MIKLDYNSTTSEAETGLSQILGQPGIYSETLPRTNKQKNKQRHRYLQRGDLRDYLTRCLLSNPGAHMNVKKRINFQKLSLMSACIM